MFFGFDDDPAERSIAPLPAATHAEPEPASAGASSSWLWIFGLIGLLLGLASALLAWSIWGNDQSELSQQDVDQAVATALDERAQAPTRAAAAYDRIAPSLVAVRATSGPDDAATIGSGIVINEQGQILTSQHVVAEAESIELHFPNGSVSQAEIESSDAALDIAVLTAVGRTSPLVPAVMGNARTLMVGDEIFAVGNPLGLTGSLTAGVISGLNRTLPFPDSQTDDVLEDLIQFDAAVNQGSSGGPLLNANGEVVGIVTALADPGGQGFFIGIGFAVPIDIAAQRAADGPSQ